MGALTSIRKCDENQSPKFPLFSSSDKKSMFFLPFMNSITNAALRVNQYPKPKKWSREVHAPRRHLKFGLGSRLGNRGIRHKETSVNVDRGVLEFCYRKAKNEAFNTFLNLDLKRDKEVIDVEGENDKDQFLGDPIIEINETNEIVENLKELDGKELVSNLTDVSLKVEDSGEMELDVLSVPAHKKLLRSAEKRNERLQWLNVLIKLHEATYATFTLLRPGKKPKDLVKEAFVPLTEKENAEVVRAFSKPNWRKILVTHENSNIEITGEILQCLKPRAWLNDEVINLYFELLKEREKREPKKFLKCHFFNTFFYKKLISGRSAYDFKSVKRWTTNRKLGYCLIDCDKIFVPIHQEVHWCLAVINKKDEKFQYLDSLKGVDKQVMTVLARYFVDEVKDKSGKDIDVSSWKQEYVEDLPAQKNGFDCGMFMIKYADFYSRDVGLCFKQTDMPYFRQRTVKEILRLKAE